MRRLVLLLAGVLTAGFLWAGEGDVSFLAETTPGEAGVVVTPIQMPMPVIEVLGNGRTLQARPVVRAKLAKKKVLPTVLLSRSARQQIDLLAAHQAGKLGKSSNNSNILLSLFNGNDAETGTDDLDLHNFYSRPRVVKVQDQEDEVADEALAVSDEIAFRLAFARLKALDSQAFQQAWVAQDNSGEGVSDAAKVRLLLARRLALRAHAARQPV